jgi:hypothetical protein
MTVKRGFTVNEISEENSVRVLRTAQNQLITNHTVWVTKLFPLYFIEKALFTASQKNVTKF